MQYGSFTIQMFYLDHATIQFHKLFLQSLNTQSPMFMDYGWKLMATIYWGRWRTQVMAAVLQPRESDIVSESARFEHRLLLIYTSLFLLGVSLSPNVCCILSKYHPQFHFGIITQTVSSLFRISDYFNSVRYLFFILSVL